MKVEILDPEISSQMTTQLEYLTALMGFPENPVLVRLREVLADLQKLEGQYVAPEAHLIDIPANFAELSFILQRDWGSETVTDVEAAIEARVRGANANIEVSYLCPVLGAFVPELKDSLQADQLLCLFIQICNLYDNWREVLLDNPTFPTEFTDDLYPWLHAWRVMALQNRFYQFELHKKGLKGMISYVNSLITASIKTGR